MNSRTDLYSYLDRIPKFRDSGSAAANFELERFRSFCGEMGDPQQAYPTLHLAGTNGKGSTCMMLDAIFREGGYRTGLYTSPHLLDYRERIRVAGVMIPEERLLDFLRRYRQAAEEARLTYFELSTAIAFWWFRECGVDLAIIETGLGGRLDATNIITPVLSLITNISLDHTDLLGDTLPEIAREKAGIIKPGVPVVTGNIPDETMEVIDAEAARAGSPLFRATDLAPRWEEGKCRLKEAEREIVLETDLANPVQAYNIAVAWQAARVLRDRFPLGEEQIRRGLAGNGARLLPPGRFEQLDPRLSWYFDGAHNPDAVAAMVAAVSAIKPVEEAVLVLSLMRDKLSGAVMDEFQKFKKIYYYPLESDRAASLEEVKQWAPQITGIPPQGDRQAALLKELTSELVIFAGSFYFYDSVRKWLTTLHHSH